ncbi:MAG TPA: DNA polymerase III subunit alpha [Pseudomonadales bacterium]
MTASFVHLRVHSEYSLIDSVIRIKPLVKKAAGLGMPALALTDQCNFYGLIKFYKAALAAGIKPIIGSDFLLLGDDDETSQLTLLAMNEQGYRNITELISLAYLKGQSLGIGRIRWQWLEQYSDGVIALSGAKFGDIGKALLNDNQDMAQQLLQKWMQLFPRRFYLELQRTGRMDDENYLHAAVALAASNDCPVVATNDVRFLEPDEYDAHEARVCIQDGQVLDDPRRERRYSAEQYLRSNEEMISLFADIPSAIDNTVEIARRCNVQLKLGTYYLPEYPIPEGMTQENFFRQVSHDGLTERLHFLFDPASAEFPAIEKRYRERLDFELNVILQMGFPGYFLIVMDFIAEAKRMQVPVGPGRGSGAGSLVAYALKITDLDPLQYDLLFERFLNPERVSMPDFDIDFCMERRGEVIQYVAEKYGEMAVSQIATFGTMAAKAVVRDVARVQGKPYGLADRLSKMIPFEVGMTLAKAHEQEEVLRDFLQADSAAQEIWDMAVQLEGVVRGVGKHAGGVVIAPNKLTDFSPIYCDEQGDGKVTQFDKNDVEEAGLVKFDFLGLRTLTIIDWALAIINEGKRRSGEAEIDIARIDLADSTTFSLLKRAETTAVFQLESRGMKELIKRLQPDSLEDLIALVALFRPGPLDSGMVDDFVNRKHGRAQVAYPDPEYQHQLLKPILEPTYGVIVYQEQVMQIAQVLAGYSLGEADLLRRAMGKKKPEEMAKQRDVFRQGAAAQGIDPELAMKIFDLVEKFAGYGFNKSHSAAYALVSYQTAWLKTHYPAQFMAAVLSSELQNTDKIVTLIEECRRMGLTICNPDVNIGEYRFTVDADNRIVYGLGAIKGLGEGPVNALIEARAAGLFSDLYDFCRRCDLRRINKRALEALIRSGAFDSLGESRALLLAAVAEAVQAAEQQLQNDNAGMVDLFAAADSSAEAGGQGDVYANQRHVAEFTRKERLAGEKETLGLFLTGHPIDDYEQELKQMNCRRLMHLQADDAEQQVAGLVISLRPVKTRRGDKLMILTLDDRTGRIEVTVFAKLLPEVEHKLKKDTVLFVRGRAEMDEFSGGLRMRAESIADIQEIRSGAGQRLRITLDDGNWHAHSRSLLESLLQAQATEGCGLEVAYTSRKAGASAVLRLPAERRITPDEQTIEQLKKAFGEQAVGFVRG